LPDTALFEPLCAKKPLRGLTCRCMEEKRYPYLTLPPGSAGSYTCPVLKPYQLGPMRIPKCNHKVAGSGHKAVDGYEAVDRRL